MIDVLHHKLKSLYKPSLFEYKSNGGIVYVNEHDPRAKVRKASISYHGQLLIVDNCLLKECHKIYDDNTTGCPELQHDCDGIFFIKYRNKKYFVLIELKSKYTEENITKAEKQLAASFVRVLSRLSCIDGFNADEYVKCGIIVSYAPNISDLRKTDQKRGQSKSALTRYDRQMRAFSKDKGCFELDKIFVRLGDLPLRRDLMFDRLPVFHINVDKEADSVRFDMDDILKEI